ncbi:nicotinamidase-related amidase [Streptosporangium becharense]|uniref:Nicotinamidase-related amidase n=1 Tax=Streptosporangium becharense TaxID=1816182 RepID=A0A7W9MDT7_9ACTN|nr:isochorismatase family protein [Streptosporangium becharense]MBB2914093.1 nicotinamidase-related amidase [Streptosporangium becharense]MBB5817120.1 nicotinamidase-related amidase [Streptosporangium becharense]
MTTPRRALILIDVQQEYFGGGPLEIQYPPHAESLPQITHAIDAATAAGVPVVAVQHTMGEDAPVFNPTRPGFRLHPEVESRRTDEWKSVVKQYGTVFAGTDLLAWLRDRQIDTITLVGYMTNNCVLASAAEAETHGLAAEVLSDATGAINIANEAGFADAKTVHTTLLALFNSNFAAVADTATWSGAVAAGRPLPKSDLGTSAVTGAQRAAQA